MQLEQLFYRTPTSNKELKINIQYDIARFILLLASFLYISIKLSFIVSTENRYGFVESKHINRINQVNVLLPFQNSCQLVLGTEFQLENFNLMSHCGQDEMDVT